jgi:glycine cleavage system H protein
MVVLLILVTLIIAVTLEIIISKSRKTAPESAAVPVFNRANLFAPAGYYFSKFHTWAHPEEDGIRIGIDNFALKALGNIRIKSIVPAGEKVNKGDSIIEAEVHGQKINFRSPVSGVIKATNKELCNGKLTDAFGKDWGLKIEAEPNMIEKLLFGSDASHWLKTELRKFKDFLNQASFTPQAVGVTMYDGGNFVEGAISSLDSDVIKDFESEFLSEKTNA